MSYPCLLIKLVLGAVQVYSAGTNPSSINPYAIIVMAEIGIDISNQYSKSVNEFLEMKFDHIITVCDHAKETCPVGIYLF